MKSIIIYESVHHGNTEKVARAIGEVLKAELVKPQDVNINELKDYELIGFGSGIFYGKFHKNILKLVKEIKAGNNQKAFVFSTSGQGREESNHSLKEELTKKGFQVVGSFACKGFDTFGPLKLVGGIAKGRPNAEDISNAKKFAEGINI
ncbi:MULTISPECIES: flavodoxin family protein [Clostridium]|uniref:flavodoxin family protein n=1 Tax=Clostridium TaxID=1485 RepID=UPI000826D123|nr:MULTISPECIES: flavodoxin family protein [Clostridium]PJI08189.1 flavodoxin [Clostridium sp. CT7]